MTVVLAIEFKYRFCGHEYRCAYCWQPAETVDHTVPRSHVRDHLRAYRDVWFPKVSACAECNGLLCDKVMMRFSERKEYIRARLIKRNKRLLSALGWERGEIRELGYNLRSKIAGSLSRAEVAASRIRFAGFPVTQGVPDMLFEQFIHESSAQRERGGIL